MQPSSLPDKPLIHYNLTDINEILPWETSGAPAMNWFGLTDANLHLNIDNKTIYEYSPEANAVFSDGIQYSNYYLVRFVEDFTEIFKTISQHLPPELIPMIQSFEKLQSFKDQAVNYIEALRISNKLNDCELEEYECLISWIYERALPANHLIGGPIIWFFRYLDEIKIIWKADHRITPDTFLWLFPNGHCTLRYDFFVREIEIFGNKFFSDMAKRVELALSRDWDKIAIDKENLKAEQVSRKQRFYRHLSELSCADVTDWSSTLSLITEMKNRFRFKN